MKLIQLSILLFSLQIFSQNTSKDSIIQNKKHEFKFAPISLLATANLVVGYEHGEFNNLMQQMIIFIFVELWKKSTNDLH